MQCFVGIRNDDWKSHTWSHGTIVGFSLCAAVLLVLVILAVALIIVRRRLWATKCRWRRGRRRIDGGSDGNDREQSRAADETCKRLLDSAGLTPVTTAVVAPCGGVKFYLKVVTPDSAGDNLSPSSLSSGDGEAKLEHRQLGDGSTGYDRDLVCATLKREILAAKTGSAWDCELCHCQRSLSTCYATANELSPINYDESSMSNHRCSWTDRRSAGIGPAAGDRTIPRCRVATPCVRSGHAGIGLASTADISVGRPRSWCSCMHVDNGPYSDRCPSAIAEPREPRCCDVTGNDGCHVTTLDRRRQRKCTSASGSSLQTT